MGRNSYSADGQLKLCTGSLHREGVYLPLHRYFMLKSGHRAGKLMSECMDCWRDRQGTRASWDVEIIWPVVERLKLQLGSEAEIVRRIGATPDLFSRMRHAERVKGKTMERLIELDREIREASGKRPYHGRDPFVVTAEPLGQILRNWCRDFIQEHERWDFEDQAVQMGPQDYIFRECHGNLTIRYIGDMCNGRVPFVELWRVDLVLAAIEMPQLIHTGEIKVIANPQWSLERYVAFMEERGCV